MPHHRQAVPHHSLQDSPTLLQGVLGASVVLHADRIIFHNNSIHQKTAAKQPVHNNRQGAATHRVLRWKTHVTNTSPVGFIANTQPLFPPSLCCHHRSSNAPVQAMLGMMGEKVPFSKP
ncbi:hypothetical protein TcCL_NonESM09476 [Trypanosoma cruzi]|nr:hypothetical protein TcCL_NonESM09476 [Trypanosoma cruzi]